MNRRWKGAVAALLTALTITTTAFGAEVVVGDTALPAHQAWVENGTSYITLRAFAAQSGYALSWDGAQARLSGGGLELTARPGDLYVTANGRPLYVAEGVRVVDGATVLPLRVLADAAGADLTWDGSAARLDWGQTAPARAAYNSEDLYWLARVISAESRGESLLGQMAVGNVVLNRLNSPVFPNSLYEVIFQTGQFEPVENGTIHHEPYHLSVLAAKLCLEGAEVVGDCLYFFAPALSRGTWIVSNRTYHTTIGCHRFYL